MRRSLRTVLLFLVFLSGPLLSAAEPREILIYPDTVKLRLPPYAVSGVYDAGQPPVLPAAVLNTFKPIAAASLNRGMDPRETWVYAVVTNRGPLARDLVLQTSSVDTRCHTFRGLESGALEALEEWETGAWIVNYALPLEPGERVKLFSRCRATGNLSAEFDLMDLRYYQQMDRKIWVINAFFYGGMLAIFLYNLFLYFSLREAGYLDYLGFMLCTMGFQSALDGTAWTLFLGIRANYLLAIIAAAAAPIFLIRFARHLLDTREHLPRWDRFLLVLLGVYVLLTLGAPWISQALIETLMAPIVLCYPLVLFWTGLLLLRQNKRVALVFLFALGISLVPFVIVTLHLVGIDLIDDSVLSGKDLMKFGSLLEGSILAFALGIKINGYRDELIAAEKKHAALLERTVADRTAELRQANSDKDKFLSILAHDLRGPIGTAAVVFDDLIRNGEDIDQELLRNLHSSARSTYTLLEDLLQWSIFQSGRVVEVKSIRMGDLLATTEDLLGTMAARKDIELVSENPDDLWVRADPAMIRTVIRNLVGNALKFTPPGGRVRMIVDRSGNDVRTRIADSGVGMNPVTVYRLFKSEEREPRPGTAGERGSGLGLSLFREFIELNHGMIGVDSTAGSGSTFWFTLPLAAAEDGTDPDLDLLLERLRATRVLVVDDSPLHTRSTVRALDELAIQSTVAVNGQAALDQFATDRFDLVLLDIDMPVMDGFTAGTKLREQHPELAIIALSGYGRRDLEERSAGAIFDGYLSRPLQNAELFEVLKPLMSRDGFRGGAQQAAAREKSGLVSEPREADANPDVFAGKLILIITDREPNARAMKAGFGASPVVLHAARGIEDALDLVRQIRFDLIMLDISGLRGKNLRAARLIRGVLGPARGSKTVLVACRRGFPWIGRGMLRRAGIFEPALALAAPAALRAQLERILGGSTLQQ